MAVPGSIALRVLCTNSCCCAIGTAEHYGAPELTARHVPGLRCRVDNVVDSLHSEIPRHELDDRSQASETCAHTKACETHFCDGGVDDALVSILGPQSLRDFVCTVVLCDLLT